MKAESIFKAGKFTALITLFFGTIILLFYFFTAEPFTFAVGYAYIILAVVSNLTMLMLLIFKGNKDAANRKKLIETLSFLFINIPVCLLYVWLAIQLSSYARITFENNYSYSLSNLKGCENIYFPELKAGESRTVWIKIITDCSIEIEYLQNNNKRRESVFFYLTPGMGTHITHHLGFKNPSR